MGLRTSNVNPILLRHVVCWGATALGNQVACARPPRPAPQTLSSRAPSWSPAAAHRAGGLRLPADPGCRPPCPVGPQDTIPRFRHLVPSAHSGRQTPQLFLSPSSLTPSSPCPCRSVRFPLEPGSSQCRRDVAPGARSMAHPDTHSRTNISQVP